MSTPKLIKFRGAVYAKAEAKSPGQFGVYNTKGIIAEQVALIITQLNAVPITPDNQAAIAKAKNSLTMLAKYLQKSANTTATPRNRLSACLHNAGLRTAGQLAALPHDQLIKATGNALRRVVSNISKLITEAKAHGGDTVCISNFDEEYLHVSAADAEALFQESLELLYGLDQIWARGGQTKEFNPGVDLRDEVQSGIADLRADITTLVEAALNGQPDRICLNLAALDSFAKKVSVIVRFFAATK